MNTEKDVPVKLSKLDLARALAEAEVARRRAAKSWLAAILLPVLVGSALLILASCAVTQRLALIGQLDARIDANQERIEAQAQKIAEQEKKIAEQDSVKRSYIQALEKALEEVSVEKRQEIISPLAANPDVKATTVFAVIGNRRTLGEAMDDARKLSARNLSYPVEIYRHTDGSRFYVTLGGNLTYAEAKKRIDYARQAGFKDAYVSTHATGENLYR